MRGDLTAARRDRDAAAVTALRTALAAVANAQAPPLPATSSGQPPQPPGVRAEVDRLVLTAADIDAVLAAEITDRLDTIALYEAHGRADQAGELRAQVAVLRRYLT